MSIKFSLLPEIYAKQGKTCVTETLELEEFANQLMQLLDEEMAKFKQAFDEEDDELAVKRIADVVEILYAVLDLIGVPEQSFEKIRLANKQITFKITIATALPAFFQVFSTCNNIPKRNVVF